MAHDVRNSGGSMNPPTYYDEGLQVVPETVKTNQPLEADGLQAVPNEIDPSKKTYPEVAIGREGKEATSVPFQPGLEPYMRSTKAVPAPRRSRRHLWYGLLAGAIILILIIIAVVVAVVVTKNNSNKNSSQPSTPGTSPVSANGTSTVGGTTTGVWNRTGMVAITGPQTMPLPNDDPVWLVSQRYTGDVQLSRLDSSGTWHAPQLLQLPYVMNGTFLEAISYSVASETFYHIFYIDSSGIIQNSIMTNQTNQWEPGNLGTMNWKAATNPMSMMKAWWHFNNFGKTHGVGGGIRLFAGADDGLLHEYSYDQASDSWAEGFKFQGVNGAGGNGITQNGNSTLLHLLNSQNKIELWWWNQQPTNAYPVGNWIKGGDSSAAVLPNSAVTLDGVVYFQDPQNNINTVAFAGFEDAERWLPPNVVTGVDAIPGTRMASATYNITAGDLPSVHVFCQSNDSNIVEFILNNNSGPATNLLYLPLS